jgi:hypothetical protein
MLMQLKNAIAVSSDLDANSFDEAPNATQKEIDMSSYLYANSLL